MTALDPDVHRTFFFWHVYLEGLATGVHYTWRVAGPGQQLESTPELLDSWTHSAPDGGTAELVTASAILELLVVALLVQAAGLALRFHRQLHLAVDGREAPAIQSDHGDNMSSDALFDYAGMHPCTARKP